MDGAGTIIGSSEVERNGTPQQWTFRYETRDGGRSWSEPVRVENGGSADGIFVRIGEQDEALLQELRDALG